MFPTYRIRVEALLVTVILPTDKIGSLDMSDIVVLYCRLFFFSVTCSLVTAEFAAWLSDQSNACRVESPGLSVSPKPPVSHMRYQRSLSKPYEGFYGPLMRSVIARVVERYVQGRGRWFIWLVAGIYGVILCNRIWDIWVIFCGANIYER